MPGNHFYPQLKQLIEPDVIPEDFSTFELNVGSLLDGLNIHQYYSDPNDHNLPDDSQHGYCYNNLDPINH